MLSTEKQCPTSVTGAAIRIAGLEKHYGQCCAVRDFHIDIRPGEFISVLGASGSGKTTVLRMLAGLETPTSGHIFINGTDAVALPPEKREIGLVFQDYALFPHMSVRKNVAFPLRMRGLKKSDVAKAVDDILSLVGASHLGERRPSQLSGGQQQRVALARALIFGPKLLLLDEPLSALDKNLREHMKSEIKALHKRTGVTVIYVTHDQSEALALSDRVVVMRDGSILDIGEPSRLYQLPSSAYLATFLGDANLLDAEVQEATAAGASVRSAIGTVDVPTKQIRVTGAIQDQPVKLVIRPESLVIEPPKNLPHFIRFRCRIDQTLYNGAYTIYTMTTVASSISMIAHCGEHHLGAFQPGDEIDVGLRRDRSVVVRADQGEDR